jgi:hypothetical protein
MMEEMEATVKAFALTISDQKVCLTHFFVLYAGQRPHLGGEEACFGAPRTQVRRRERQTGGRQSVSSSRWDRRLPAGWGVEAGVAYRQRAAFSRQVLRVKAESTEQGACMPPTQQRAEPVATEGRACYLTHVGSGI